MATLQTIRTKAGLLISVVIGVALLAFLLGDLLSAGQSMFVGSRTDVAEISGNMYSIEEFETKVSKTEELYKIQGQMVDDNNRQQFRDEVWQQFLEEKMLTPIFEKFAIEVSDKELYNLVAGDNIDPLVYSLRFLADPNTGRFDINRVKQFIASIDNMRDEDRRLWVVIENDIKDRRAINKYNTLIQKGLFATDVDVENIFNERNFKTEFDYAVKKYADIKNGEIKISEDELQNYYDENKHKYKQENEWDITYVTIDIKPSEEDKEEALKDIEAIKEDFTDDKEVKDFINYNSSNVIVPEYVKQGDVTNNELDTFLFSSDKGAIFGPYVDEDTYKIAKIIETKEIADSVWARHIMIQPQANIKTQEQFVAMVDSIKDIITADSSRFAGLAMQYNTDMTKLNGGNLGWFERANTMTQYRVHPSFADSIFFAEKGDILKISSGMAIHLVQILDKGGYTPHIKVAYVDRTMDVSKATRNLLFNQATDFANKCTSYETFKSEAEKNKLQTLVANNLKEMTSRVGALKRPRPLVKWAMKAEINDISEVFDFEATYVVGILVAQREKGLASLESVKPYLSNELYNKKKADKIIADLGQFSDIESVASKFGCELFTAQNMSLSAAAIPNAGNEPIVLAQALSLKQGQVSKAIAGNNGVYVVRANTLEAPETDIDLEGGRQNLISNDRSKALGNRYMPGEAKRALMKRAEIVDMRSHFE